MINIIEDTGNISTSTTEQIAQGKHAYRRQFEFGFDVSKAEVEGFAEELKASSKSLDMWFSYRTVIMLPVGNMGLLITHGYNSGV